MYLASMQVLHSAHIAEVPLSLTVSDVANSFRAHSGYIRHETFSFMLSLPAMSSGLSMSRKGGTGEGGCLGAPKGYVQTVWPRLGLSLEATRLSLGGQFLSFLA